jgi:hypothetical protein
MGQNQDSWLGTGAHGVTPTVLQELAPEILAAADGRSMDACTLLLRVLRSLTRFDLPTGARLDRAWILIVPKKLESPNKTVWRHWRVLSRERQLWEALLWTTVARVERCASVFALHALGRAPACSEPMALTVYRFVRSAREFIKDDDNLAFSIKHANDSMKRIRLVKDDNRTWLQVSLPIQDVSPIDTPVTVFVLRPAAAAGLPQGVSDVHRPVRPSAHRQDRPPDGGAEERRALPRVRRRAGARTVDV